QRFGVRAALPPLLWPRAPAKQGSAPVNTRCRKNRASSPPPEKRRQSRTHSKALRAEPCLLLIASGLLLMRISKLFMSVRQVDGDQAAVEGGTAVDGAVVARRDELHACGVRRGRGAQARVVDGDGAVLHREPLPA